MGARSRKGTAPGSLSRRSGTCGNGWVADLVGRAGGFPREPLTGPVLVTGKSGGEMR